jgi:2-keto-4-pentenoate hydratase/2-oxohepta-3-ene-1,7-dioic acid hydratase in catechol pathway
MKLVRFGEPGKEQPGILIEDASGKKPAEILNIRQMAFDIEDYNRHFFSIDGIARLNRLLQEENKKTVPLKNLRLGAPVAEPTKIICLGKNYAAHAQEFDAKMPAAPILFCKAPSSIIGAFDKIAIPANSNSVDIEVELAIVIGKKAKNVSRNEALNFIAGYMVLNDVTDRKAQKDDCQWFRGKSADTFCPIGPYLVTPDEVGDYKTLKLKSSINGAPLQDDVALNMIFDIPTVISYISQSITLLPGDIIATGTPAGVGFARNPPLFIKAGDVVECEVEKLGKQRNKVVASSQIDLQE